MFRDNFQRQKITGLLSVHCVLHFAARWRLSSRAHSSQFLCVNEATGAYKMPMRTGQIESPRR